MPDLTPIRQFLANNQSKIVEIDAADLKLLVEAAERASWVRPRVPVLSA